MPACDSGMVRVLAFFTMVVSLPAASHLPGVGILETFANAKIHTAGKDAGPAHLLVAVWVANRHRRPPLADLSAAAGAVDVALGYIVIVSPFKTMAKFADDRNAASGWDERWRDWPAQSCRAYMILLAAIIFLGLRAHQGYSSSIEGFAALFYVSRPWAWGAVALALLTMVLQAQWGTRLYRTPAVLGGTDASAVAGPVVRRRSRCTTSTLRR